MTPPTPEHMLPPECPNTQEPEPYSGYEADAEERSLTSEEDDDMTLSESPIIRRSSLSQLLGKRRGRGSRNRHLSSSSSSSSSTSSSVSSSYSSSYSSFSSACARVKRQRLIADYSDSDGATGTNTLYVGRTSCRSHGQYPRRQQTKRQYNWPAKASLQYKWPAPTSLMILERGGVVGGVASNLNDQEVNTCEVMTHNGINIVPANKVSLKLLSEVVIPASTPSAPSTISEASVAVVSTSVASSTPSSLQLQYPHILQSVSLSLVHCIVSPNSCTIAEALSFSPRARLLLEAKPPHHVVHHNGAYESFLQDNQRTLWGSPELLRSMEYPNLTTAVQDLFGAAPVILHPVQRSQHAQSSQNVITHFLLELAPSSPTASLATAAAGATLPIKTTSSSFLQGQLPARAVG